MRKSFLFALVVLTTAAVAFAQYAAPASQTVPDLPYVVQPPTGSIQVEVKNQFFDIISDAGSYDAEVLMSELAQRFEVYNRLFRFNPAALAGPLKVRVFSNKGDYDRYVSERLPGMVRDGAVYLHYNQPERRELVINRGSPEEGRALPHQAFIQYLRAFIPQPPTWMREGFSIYFNTLRFDKASRELHYEENLSWLETVKRLGPNAPSLDAVMLADIRGQPDYFQPVCWALVSFFLNAGQDHEYYRTLTETFILLSADRSAAENSQIVIDRIYRWTNPAQLANDYTMYIASRQTFLEMIEEGQRAYYDKNYEMAEQYFKSALFQKPTHYAPYYYLGLLAFEKGDYTQADTYYRSALQYGGDVALLNYALGINAASAMRNPEAISYLETAIAISPERYQERAAPLLARLRGDTAAPATGVTP